MARTGPGAAERPVRREPAARDAGRRVLRLRLLASDERPLPVLAAALKAPAMRLAFGDCVFDTGSRELLRGGARQELSPKAFQFLELLLEARPRVLTKQELQDRLWPDAFVSESSLPRLAAEARAAIGDDAREGRLLRTVHRYGYAFSGEATVSEARPPALSVCRLL